jgi:hypothetical protein
LLSIVDTKTKLEMLNFAPINQFAKKNPSKLVIKNIFCPHVLILVTFKWRDEYKIRNHKSKILEL